MRSAPPLSRRIGALATLLLTFALWLPGTLAWGATPPALVLEGAPASTNLEPYLAWRCDPGGEADIDAIRQQPFSALAGHSVVFGFRAGACWFRFRVENRSTSPQSLILQLPYPILDRVELHQPGRATPVLTGDLQPFANRPLSTRFYNFPLQLAPGEGQDYFLRVASSSSMNVPLVLFSAQSFAGEQETTEWWNGLGFGIIAGLLLYHLFLWLAVREKVFRYYVFYVSAALFYLLCMNGIAYRLWPEAPDWNAHAQPFGLLLMLSASALFARDFLGPKRLRPAAELALRAIAGFTALLALLQFALPLHVIYPMQALLTFPVAAAIVVAAWPLLRNRPSEIRIFLLSWTPLILMALLLALQSLGLFASIPFLLTLKAVEATFILQLLLLALALADRLNTLKREWQVQQQSILKVEAESAAKTEFLARMSHEIRTPLNAVLGITQLLQDTRLDKAQQNYVDTLLSSGHALLHIINDILDYSKIIAGKIQLEQREFNLLDLLDECVQVFSFTAREKSLSLVCERSRDLPAWVRGDAGRLRQVLLNLLSNAVKFTEAGTVHLRVSVLERGNAQLRLCFEVEDSGIGIPADQVPLLFSSFMQADASTSREYGGTGLGLAISRQLVELMQGRISVSSAPGQGSIFRFTVLVEAVAHAPALAPADSEPLAERFEGVMALVVEDNPINQVVIGGFLAKLGVAATQSSSAQEALDLLQRGDIPRFDVIFMDCEMPHMDGFEATRRLRQWETEQGVSRHVVVALTAHALPEHRDQCLAAGMDEYLSKPLVLPRLAEMLRSVLK